jgi:hypothetical protein
MLAAMSETPPPDQASIERYRAEREEHDRRTPLGAPTLRAREGDGGGGIARARVRARLHPWAHVRRSPAVETASVSVVELGDRIVW